MAARGDGSAIQRLASGTKGEAFLERHHLAAAERLERLVTRASLGPRLTMSYDPAAVTGRGGGNHAAELSDSAADARERLNRLAASMPDDCWSIAIDVCGFGKGLQTIETERSWPRRSAKLVLRIALDQLARQFGLAPHRAGDEGGRHRGWLEQRLPLIDEREEP